MVILADHALEDIFVSGDDHDLHESHVLMDDLGLKRVPTPARLLSLEQGTTPTPFVRLLTMQGCSLAWGAQPSTSTPLLLSVYCTHGAKA